ncbi:MAG TPA: hypothetical protein VMV92_10270 [Streptosporangiaceae bacterium]|nr:hypothetical protein [Streptosporangiaceae bacterium]
MSALRWALTPVDLARDWWALRRMWTRRNLALRLGEQENHVRVLSEALCCAFDAAGRADLGTELRQLWRMPGYRPHLTVVKDGQR